MKKIYGLLLIVAIMIGCGKDDDPKLTVEQYLTAASNGWVYESLKFTDPDSGTELDLLTIPDLFAACDLDDATIFTADGKFTVANNTKCDPDDPATLDSGTWALNSDKTQLTVTSTTDGPLFTLTKFSADGTNVKGELTETIEGTTLTIKLTMKKK